MFRRKAVMGALALLTGAGLAAALPALPAVAKSSPPKPLVIRPGALIIAGGAVARPGVDIVCPSGQQVSVTMTLNEVINNHIAKGKGAREVVCTGVQQRVFVKIPASRPFMPGPAFAEASFFYCTDSGCVQPTATRVVTLHFLRQ
jgi:hypothetical protein